MTDTAPRTAADELREWLAWAGTRFAGVPSAALVTKIEMDARAAAPDAPALPVAEQGPCTTECCDLQTVTHIHPGTGEEEWLERMYVPPAPHMRQSVNGCVTCPRRWSDHSDAEREAAAPDAPAPQALDVIERIRAKVTALHPATPIEVYAILDAEYTRLSRLPSETGDET